MPRASRCGKIYAEICGTRNAFSLGQISQTYAFQTGVSEKKNENTRHRCRRTNSRPKRVENATEEDGQPFDLSRRARTGNQTLPRRACVPTRVTELFASCT